MLIHQLLQHKAFSEVDIVQTDTTLLELVSVLSTKSIGSVVVVDDTGKMIGIVTEKDVVRTVSQKYAQIPNLFARDIMTTNVITCELSDSISETLDRMRVLNIRHMPVVDNGKLLTVIGMRDMQAICQHLGQLATTDSLTGLSNRRAFDNAINAEYVRFQRHSTVFSIASLDIDFFKKINDTHGHAAGDMILVEFAKIFQTHLRAFDFPARVGGEEFSLIFPNTILTDAISICDRLSEAIRGIELYNDSGTIKCTASFGVTTITSDFADIDSIIKYSDELLYDAKEQGRDRIVAKIKIEETATNPVATTNHLDEIFFQSN